MHELLIIIGLGALGFIGRKMGWQLGKNGIKTLKTFHHVAVACWLGGAIVMVLLLARNEVVVSDGMLLGINTAISMIDHWIVPWGAIGVLVTALIYALFTPWGFFKHRWLTCKWVLTLACIISAVFEQDLLSISQALGNAALTDSNYLAMRSKQLLLGYTQIFFLLFMVAISVFQPWRKKDK